MSEESHHGRSTHDGKIIAELLQGAWHAAPPVWTPSLEAGSSNEVAPLVDSLLELGAGGLAWHRLTAAKVQPTAELQPLADAYKLGILKSALMEQQLEELFREFRAAGIEPILCKGWSVARLYPHTGLRSSADIDLSIDPQQLHAAKQLLQKIDGRCGWVDLHTAVPDLKDRSWESILSSSQLKRLGDSEIRILGAEDQLRHLCLHFWRHLGCRPLWLCDIGATVESIPESFDWDACLRGNRSQRASVLCVIGLAQKMLGAEIESPEIATRASRLPRWLAPSILWHWASHRPIFFARKSIPDHFADLLHGKFNPIRAALRTGLTPHSPLPILQLSSLGLRPFQLAVRIERALKKPLQDKHLSFALHGERLF